MYTIKKSGQEQGQGLVEYALIMVLVAVIVIVVLALLGGGLGGLFNKDQPYMPRTYYAEVDEVIIREISVNSTNVSGDFIIPPNARIAIYNFESPKETQGGILASDTFAALLRQRGLEVFERDQINRILTEQNLIVEGKVVASDLEIAGKLGALETVDYMIFGAVTLYQSESQTIFRPVRIRQEDIPVYIDDYNEYREWYVDGFRPLSIDYWTLSSSERAEKMRKELEVLSLEELQRELEETTVSEVRNVASIGISAKIIDIKSGEIVWMGQAETTDFTLVGGANRIIETLIESFLPVD